MKLISLNIWGGKVFDPLIAFLKESAGTTDIFCFQEVFDSTESHEVTWGGRADILTTLCGILPNFQSHFASIQERHDGDRWADSPLLQGPAIFVRQNIVVDDAGDIVVHGVRNGLRGDDLATYPCNLVYARFQKERIPYTVGTVHGTAYPGSKLDTPERLMQSQKIIQFFGGTPNRKILCGDFNLMPDTESIRMIERSGMRNLVREFHIESTRSAINYERYPEKEWQKFADYCFVSPDIAVGNFTVPDISVSDHLPLVLEFE